MAERTKTFYVCDCCGAEDITPVRGGERGPIRYEISVSEDVGVAGGRIIGWSDLCEECHEAAARFASEMRKYQKSARAILRSEEK